MKKQIEFISRYLVFWVVIFAVMRGFFILYNAKLAATVDTTELLKSFVYGLRMDFSVAGYFSIIPLLLSLVVRNQESRVLNKVFAWYNYLLLIMVVVITLIDAQLYGFWGQKLNAYASSFAKFPKEMFSFSSGLPIGKLVFFVVLSFFATTISYDSIVLKLGKYVIEPTLKYTIVYFLISASGLFLMIRGNIGMSTLNTSFAYYSATPFCNHAAVNSTWYFMASALEDSDDEKKNTYQFVPSPQAEQYAQELYQQQLAQPISLTTVNKPHILVLILEGWTADVVGFTNGLPDVTPQLNAWVNRSLVYTNFYANGNRTDKGLAAIISAQPAMANKSILNRLEKFTNIPSLPKQLKQTGYQTRFVYGGESEFANMRAYWVNSGYDRITDIHQFKQLIMPEVWGVHDDELYNRLLHEMGELRSPEFITALTLSSHEPYNVPHKSKFNADTEAERYKNAVHYSDQCLGLFLQKAARQKWYNNTLIFILSDHGHQEPNGLYPYEPARFHIPMLVTGGALNQSLRGKQVHKISQQLDLSAGILYQLGLPFQRFKWSKNLLDTNVNNGFATYTFSNGIGIVKPQGYTVFDEDGKRIIMNSASDSTSLTYQARAYQQLFYQDYLQR